MPTEIKVVIPRSQEEDDDVIKQVKEEVSTAEISVMDVYDVRDQPLTTEKNVPNSQTPRFRTRKSLSQRQTLSTLQPAVEPKVLFTQQYHLPLDMIQAGDVRLDKGQGPSSVRTSPKKRTCHGQPAGHSVQLSMSISGTYDIDVEHRDIMMKALRAYSQHCCHDGEGDGSSTLHNMDTAHVQNGGQGGLETQGVRGQTNQKTTQVPSRHGADINGTNRDFRLAQCRLRFHDDVDAMASVPMGRGPSLSVKRKPWVTSSPAVITPVPTLYPLQESDGLIVDSVGHVYQHRRIRPWTALPGRYVDFVRANKSAHHENLNIRASDTGRSSGSRLAADPPTRRRSTSSTAPSHHTRVATDSMSDTAHHSMAFQRRNRTTHIWTDGSQLMSTSLPTGSFLHQHVNSSSLSSPRSSRSAASEKTSPAGKPARPSSSYSYDGGFFLGAHAGHAEYFVIHPDWVSEAVTIKKLSIGSKTSTPPVSKSASFRGGNWCGRRCLSAPPAKRRNPITWDVSDPIDIPAKL